MAALTSTGIMHNTVLKDLTTIIEYFDDMVAVLDTQYRCISFNSGMAEAIMMMHGSGLRPGDYILDHIPPGSRLYWQEMMQKVYAGGTVSEESVHKKANGETLFLHHIYKPIIHEDQVVGSFLVVKNITREKLNEIALTESRHLYHQLAANIPGCDLFLTDLDLRILLAEGNSIKNMGLSDAYFRGRSVFEISGKFTHDEKIGQELDSAYTLLKDEGRSTSIDFQHGQTHYFFQTAALANENGERNYNLIVFRDVTLQKTIERNLMEINRSKDNILGIVAHDLRNPISSILGLLDLIKHSPDNTAEFLDLISKSGQNALNIITDLLDITSLDGASSLSRSTIEINSFIKNIIASHATFIGDKELNITYTSTHEKIYVPVSPTKISRVFNNLLMNAVKFSYRGKEIRINTTLREGLLITTVEDQGIGIPRDLQHIIFDKFTKASRQGTEGEKSIGLGMSIVKRIVQLHNGRIYMSSKENEGTSFYVELPGASEGPENSR